MAPRDPPGTKTIPGAFPRRVPASYNAEAGTSGSSTLNSDP